MQKSAEKINTLKERLKTKEGWEYFSTFVALFGWHVLDLFCRFFLLVAKPAPHGFEFRAKKHENGSYLVSYSQYKNLQRKTRILFIISALFLFSSISLVSFYFPGVLKFTKAASTYYIATTGSDANNGSQGSPWQTISYALTQVADGDTINVAAGTYTDLDGDALATNTISILGAGADTTIIQNNAATATLNITGAGATISGFTFSGTSTDARLYLGNSAVNNTTIQNNIFVLTSGIGVQLFGATTGVSINNNTFTSSASGSTAINVQGNATNLTINNNTASSGNLSNFFFSSGTLTTPTITGNTLSATIGNHFVFNGTSSNATIANNTLANASDTAIKINAATAAPTITNNTIRNNAVSIDFEASISNAAVANNFIYNNTYGIMDNGNTTTAAFTNNTIYNNTNYGIRFSASTSSGITIKNNIITNNGVSGISTDPSVSSVIASSYNNIYNNTANWTNITQGTGDISQDPLFTNASSGNFILQNYSPSIDAGDPENSYTNEPAPNGTRINQGAYGNTAQATVSPTAWYINATSGNNTTGIGSIGLPYTTLTKVLTRTDAGDTITLSAGTYNNALGEIFPVNIAVPNLTIQGAGSSTLLAGENNKIISVGANGITIADLKIQGVGGSPPNESGIRITGTNTGVLLRNIIINGQRVGQYGILLDSASGVTIQNTIVYNTTGDNINLTGSSAATLTNLVLYGSSGTGLITRNSSSASIKNSIITSNNYGLVEEGTSQITSTYNNIVNNTTADYGNGTSAGTGDISSSPLFLSTTLGSEDFHLQSGSPSIDLGDPSDSYSNETQPNGSRINQGAYGNIATVEVSSVSGLGAGGGVTDNTPPDAISDLSSVSSTINSLTLSWTDVSDDGGITGNEKVQAYEIRYSLNPITPENFSSAVIYQYASSELFPKTPGTTNQLTINGLLEDTTYSVAIKSVDNNVNWSSISNIITVKTASSVPIQQTTAAQEQTPTTEQTQSTTQEQSPTQPTTPTEQTPSQEPTSPTEQEQVQEQTTAQEPTTQPSTDNSQQTTNNSQPSTTEQEQTLTTEEPASPTSPTQTTTGDVSQSSSTPSPTTLSLTFKKPSEGEQGYINKKQPTVVCKTKPVQKNHSVVFSVDNKVDKTVSTNKEGICEFTPSSELSEGKHVIKAEMQLNTKIIGKSIEFIVDTKKPGIPVIGEMTFQKFKKINDEETETEITISGANITEDLSAFVICIAPLQKNILILKKVVKLELPADDLHPETKTRWLKTITRRIPVGDIALWNWVEDKAGNISGTPCEDEPEEPEVISGFGPDTTTITFSYPACSDLFDNDWDGYMDYPNDKECSSSSDETEDVVEEQPIPSQCNDKLDNDMDNNIDLSDMGCSSYEDDNEADELTGAGGYSITECFDTIDNDRDSVSDYPNDTGCREKYDPTEGADSTPPDAPVVSQIKATAITPTDTVNTYKVTISAHGIKTADSKTITLIIESNPFEVTFTPEIQSLSWNYDITIALEVGEHRVYAYATDYDGNRSSQSNTIEFEILQQGVVEIQEPEETLVETIVSTITDNKVVSAIAQIPAVKAVIDNVIENPKVEEMNETVVAPVITAVVIANTAAAVGTGFNILAYLQYLITSPILLLARKKRKSWGVVYNTLTKQPVDLAIVRLYETGTNILLQTRVTDREGRYQFIVGPGKYYLTVSKPGFLFPTTYLRYKKEDISFVDLYHGDTINSTSKQGTIGVNIPLDPAEKKEEPTKRVIFNQLFRSFQRIIGFSGILLALVSFIISPIPLLLGLLVLQILLYLVFRRFAAPKKPKSWGIVYDAKTKQPISRAIVRIYDVEFHKLLETQITDSQGRYAFLVGRNVYYVAVEKEGYKETHTESLDFRNKEKERVIHMDIGLEKKEKNLSPKNRI